MRRLRRRRLAGCLLGYLVLLAVSAAFRRSLSSSPLAPGMRVLTLPAVTAAGPAAGEIRLAFVDTDPNSSSMPVVLIHGSPGRSGVFRGLIPSVADRFRIIAPDLPGFGASTHALSDYSFRAHARYLIELFDALGIRKAQLVGFSMGGGVVLSMADIAPGRVASIVMLSAIGVQEQELLGSYRANHILHGAQLAALWALREGSPHFGLLDRVELNVEYARNFYDSDQRPLRSILAKYHGPMLILHGRRDPLVPVAAALEHHRLVPQSDLRILDDNHFMVFQRPEVIAPPLCDFLQRHSTD